ncbi:MAG TPA: adenylate/guanylate cyclase domain-containing protein [Candidatus Dormibacteraeota bacterium]|jgi:adenylate cyclase|nr:adenylate/guanylate cyclase domain-containing protein [Candidatus Dormibacteraeota bacterium]
MRLTRQRRQLVLTGAILLLAILAGAAGASAGVLDQNLQAGVYDFLLTNAADAPGKQITIVAIDDDTIARYGRWPLPRNAYADAVRALEAYRPTVIAFDIGFYDQSGPQEDMAFTAAMRDAGNVILAMQGSGESTAGNGALQFQTVEVPNANLRAAAAGVGDVNVVPEIDHVVRRANLVITNGPERYFSLPLVAAARQLRADVTQLRFTGDSYVLPTKGFGDRVIPVDVAGGMRVYFAVKPATNLKDQKKGEYPCKIANEFCIVSMSDVTGGTLPADTLRPLIENRIVLIGVHSASALPDDYAVPNSGPNKMWGIEVWASVAQTILTGRFPLLREETLPTVWWIALVTLAGVVLILRWRVLGFMYALAVLVLYAAVAEQSFVIQLLERSLASRIVPAPSMAYVLASAPFWWILVVGYLALEEQEAVGRTQRAFGLAVTPEVAKHILELQDTGQLTLGGQMREATVLFGDIRGFTTLSEGMEASELLATLNRYFDGMVRIVQSWGGTVNKYNGDNIMVVWGAPIPVDDHARRAVQCALELQQFIVGERAKGGPDVSFGFGINTGPLVAGFLGAQGRFEYTVIGDTVNVASRLTSGDIARRDNVAVSERTLQALIPDVDYVDLGAVQVKGRAEPVHCYQVNRVGVYRTPNPAPVDERSSMAAVSSAAETSEPATSGSPAATDGAEAAASGSVAATVARRARENKSRASAQESAPTQAHRERRRNPRQPQPRRDTRGRGG